VSLEWIQIILFSKYDLDFKSRLKTLILTTAFIPPRWLSSQWLHSSASGATEVHSLLLL